MPTFQIAHIREQGVDLIIVPLDAAFGNRTSTAQRETTDALQRATVSAGLAGTVVPVWPASGGRMRFLAPHGFHPFFRSIDLGWVMANINRELICS
ncbi:hypothetical protein [Burkholderia ubonensis]|uniref:Uncharacterized protein n=1 Tax=Burkholderia ubonensis TaxID=101571 RepID=A0AAW3N6T5_9BURK|nr:hypothetical protein [Burkholderia ubonensis]KVT50701.1 hypothetical protein WK53_09430 [Burkholderia ubonensis]KVW46124.1 hypothetical protein WK95_08510 [Burkholderia ubonensis]